MESSSSRRSRLRISGGVLSMLGGAVEVIGGGVMVSLVIANRELFNGLHAGSYAGIRSSLFGDVDLIWLIDVGVLIFTLGIVAIIGGVSAVREKVFGLSLAGAICTLPAVIPGLYFGGAIGAAVVGALVALILGILAIIFVALGEREFRAKA
jgi:hypothetical protein